MLSHVGCINGDAFLFDLSLTIFSSKGMEHMVSNKARFGKIPLG